MQYAFDCQYHPTMRHTRHQGGTIGKVCPEDSSRMYPNHSFRKCFPEQAREAERRHQAQPEQTPPASRQAQGRGWGGNRQAARRAPEEETPARQPEPEGETEELFLTEIYVPRMGPIARRTIPLDQNVPMPALVTGSAGCGKTLLLNGIRDRLQGIYRGGPVLSFSGPLKRGNRLPQSHFFLAFFRADEPAAFLTPGQGEAISWSPRQREGRFLLCPMARLKIQQAFSLKDGDAPRVALIGGQFQRLETVLPRLQLHSDPGSFPFRLTGSGGVSMDFEFLPAGCARMVSIPADLILGVEDSRLEQGHSSRWDQKGIVLPDGPELHPTPGLQFLVATSSPWVLRSLPAVICLPDQRRIAPDLAVGTTDNIADSFLS